MWTLQETWNGNRAAKRAGLQVAAGRGLEGEKMI
jgi:hypothetical protein